MRMDGLIIGGVYYIYTNICIFDTKIIVFVFVSKSDGKPIQKKSTSNKGFRIRAIMYKRYLKGFVRCFVIVKTFLKRCLYRRRFLLLKFDKRLLKVFEHENFEKHKFFLHFLKNSQIYFLVQIFLKINDLFSDGYIYNYSNAI